MGDFAALHDGARTFNLAVTPDGKLLLATLKQGAMFEVVDLATGQSLARLKNSSTVANGVAVTPGSRYAFVSSEGVGAAPGKVDVYDLRALAKVGAVDVGQQAGGIAFWKMSPPARRRRVKRNDDRLPTALDRSPLVAPPTRQSLRGPWAVPQRA